jgi:hypothetical protein
MTFFRNPSLAGKRSQQVQSARRMAAPAPDYPADVDYKSIVKRVTVETIFRSVVTAVVYEFYQVRGQRRDRFRVTANGKPWMTLAGWTQFLAEIRKLR